MAKVKGIFLPQSHRATNRQTKKKVNAQEFHSGGIKMVYIFRTTLLKIK